MDELGELPAALGLMGGLTLALFALGRRADAVMVGLSLVLMGAGQALKLAVGRVRPEYVLAGAESAGFGFPSGHSVYAFLFGGLLIYLAAGLIRQPVARRIAQVALAFWVVTMGVSRVYLGVHWPSDVIGGFMFGAIALTVIIMLRNTLNHS
ncbi:MAG: phosphatase PAP2 family protein [Proteobacteria bacterium]|nr:phosphatase PAP2 family protein [Pseudomonadota bacterium]